MSQTTEPVHETKKSARPPASHHGHGAHDDAGHGHDAHAEHPFLAHHFDTPQQQFDAGKLGIWLFLVTEVLFFAGLFCAYTAYRAQHPEVFVYAHYHLDTTWGAVNTCVLLVSSLTAAWAVRCAQQADKRGLILNIVITLACAFCFLGVKYKEYSHKFHEGTLWGHHFDPEHEIWQLDSFKNKHPEAAELAERLAAISGESKETTKAESHAAPQIATAAQPAPAPADSATPAASAAAASGTVGQSARSAAAASGTVGQSARSAAAASGAVGQSARSAAAASGSIGSVRGAPVASAQPAPANAAAAAMASAETPPAVASAPGAVSGTPTPAGAPAAESTHAASAALRTAVPATTVPSKSQLFQEELAKASPEAIEPLVAAGLIDKDPLAATNIHRPFNVQVFFSIYFFMTGLHGIHVIGGIIVWIWMLTKAARGQFGPNYFGPIDYAALYWHLVDLIWIYLFPLLYLIH